MGRSTSGDLCNFAVFVDNTHCLEDNEENIFFDPYYILSELIDEDEDGNDIYATNNQVIIDFIKTKNYKNWTFDPNDKTRLSKKERLYGTIWKKDNFIVELINTSEYSNGGEYIIFAISKDIQSINEFIKDMGITREILVDEVLCQTM